MPDYIPARIADRALWYANFATLVAADPTDYGLITSDATAISTANTSFQTAYAISTDPSTRTKPTVAATDAQDVNAQFVMRPYAMRINANQTVTNEQRADLGLTVRITVPTPVPPPLTAPTLTLISQSPGAAVLAFADSTTPSRKQKPPGVVSLELWTAVGTVDAIDPAQASFRANITKTPWLLSGMSADRGKHLTLFGRWSTRSGAGGIAYVGPWSAPLSTIIT